MPTFFGRVLAVVILACPAWAEPDYANNPHVRAFINDVEERYGLPREWLVRAFADARKVESVLEAIARPAEKTMTWHRYRAIFLTQDRIERGVRFWQEHASTLAKTEQTFGVDSAIVVATLGVETSYGRHIGSYRVIDSLATLAFDYPPRSSFFRSELEQFLLLAHEEQREAATFVGSYAGAMGYGQFISSSYRAYAVDFDEDGDRDIWASIPDAVGSVANYYHLHGWVQGGEVTAEVQSAPEQLDVPLNVLRPHIHVSKLRELGLKFDGGSAGDKVVTVLELDGPSDRQLRVGFHNFYVITRYNHSHLYALAVDELASAIRSAYRAEERKTQGMRGGVPVS